MDSHIPTPDRYDGRMTYRRCGRWGLKLPAITLGCWHNFGGPAVADGQRRMIHTAFDCGITHFDLANNYGPPPGSAESNVGQILRELPRDEIIVTTKAGYLMWDGPYGEWGTRKYLLASLDRSLKRLGLDYVDIFYSHRFDPDTPLDETMSALDSAVKQGKALYVGISSYLAPQTREAMSVCGTNGFVRPIVHQPNYSMLNRWVEKGLLDACGDLGLGVIAFCPLYQGLLTDRYLGDTPVRSRSLLTADDMRPDVVAVLNDLAKLARERGQTLAQMALAWVLRDPRVTSVLIGASRPEQIVENCRALEALKFTDDELELIDRTLSRVQMPPSPWASE